MVEIFKTNVMQLHHAAMLVETLSKKFPLYKINFDLNDCDNILRVEGQNISSQSIIAMLVNNGYDCIILN